MSINLQVYAAIILKDGNVHTIMDSGPKKELLASMVDQYNEEAEGTPWSARLLGLADFEFIDDDIDGCNYIEIVAHPLLGPGQSPPPLVINGDGTFALGESPTDNVAGNG